MQSQKGIQKFWVQKAKPIMDATPLPPLNLFHQGKMWPITAKVPANIVALESIFKTFEITKKTKTVFTASSTAGKIAIFHPRALERFVDPKLPEPISLRLTLKILAVRTQKEIDPIKYPIKIDFNITSNLLNSNNDNITRINF